MKKLVVVFGLVAAVVLMVGGVSAQQEDEPGRAFRNRPRVALNLLREMTRVISQETGLAPREVLAQVRDGKTLGEVVTSNGGDVQTVIDLALESAAERLTTAVANERITQERADAILARLEALYGEMMDGALRERVRGVV